MPVQRLGRCPGLQVRMRGGSAWVAQACRQPGAPCQRSWGGQAAVPFPVLCPHSDGGHGLTQTQAALPENTCRPGSKCKRHSLATPVPKGPVSVPFCLRPCHTLPGCFPAKPAGVSLLFPGCLSGAPRSTLRPQRSSGRSLSSTRWRSKCRVASALQRRPVTPPLGAQCSPQPLPPSHLVSHVNPGRGHPAWPRCVTRLGDYVASTVLSGCFPPPV